MRVVFDREEDMVASGGRHPILTKYKVFFSKSITMYIAIME